MLDKKFSDELKNNIKLSFPIIIGQLGVVLMAVADNIMVGRLLGKIELGSAGLANAIAFLIASLAVGGLPVVAPMVSKALAENKHAYLRKLLSSTIWVAIIYCLVLSFLGYILYLNYGFFNQSPEINSLFPSYMAIIMGANAVLFIFLAFKQFTDGFSKPKVAMFITLAGLIVNVVLNYLLIEGVWIFPKLKLDGAGWATLFSRVFMLMLMLLYLLRNTSFKQIFKKIEYRVDVENISNILKRSIPGGFQFFFEIGAFTTAVIMMGWISGTALAAHNIAINIASSTYMMATGISFASGIRVGDAWGRKDYQGIGLSGNAGYLLVFLFMSLSMLLIFSFKTQILNLYIADQNVIEAAIPLLNIAALFQLSDGVQVVGLGVLRGIADIKIPTVITFIAYWVIALPLGYILSFNFGIGAIGIWLGLLTGLTVSAILLYFRFKNLLKKKYYFISKST